jgi:hypothetical protein
MAKDFSTSKLSALVSGLTGKEAALLQINYMLDEEKTGIDYKNETDVISAAVEKLLSREQQYDFFRYYNLFIYTGLFSLDLQSLRFQLNIINANLANLHTMILWSCDSYKNLILLGDTFSNPATSHKVIWPLSIVQRSLGRSQVVARENHNIVLDKDIEELIFGLIDSAQRHIKDMNNHKDVIKRIEEDYFDNKVSVCETQFTQAASARSTFVDTVTNIIKDVDTYYNIFHFEDKVVFIKGQELLSKIIEPTVDTPWVEERLKMLLSKSDFE